MLYIEREIEIEREIYKHMSIYNYVFAQKTAEREEGDVAARSILSLGTLRSISLSAARSTQRPPLPTPQPSTAPDWNK